MTRSIDSGRKGWRRTSALLLVASLSAVTVSAARADCQDDITKLMKRRLAAVALINSAAKTAGNKLDPIAACPRLRALAAIESEATAYLTKNKDWCNLPSDFVDKMSASYTRSTGFAQKACSVAVQVKKMQQQQAQQQQDAAPKLPTGPL